MEGLNTKKAWLFLAPALILMAVFTFYPMISTIVYSFINDYNGLEAAGGVQFEAGIENYKRLFDMSASSKKFLQSLGNTAILVVFTVPLSIIIALLIAVALNSIKPLQKALQTIYFLPYVTNSLAIGSVFALMFQYAGQGTAGVNGIINTVIGWFGIAPVNWIGPGSTYAANIAVLVIYIVWSALPFKILILSGALQSVNKQYYDAAKIDGTPKWRVLTKITVPLLSPMISYLFVTGFIGAFKEYSAVVGVFGTEMGPAGDHGRMNTVVARIYEFIEQADYGRASAMALALFVIILLLTIVQFQVNKKKVHF
ncbi:MAG: sugar ABC transporter permease [Roseburia sp.]|nr:sugar ABC transporter permease [Anaeroplasma bactoclasticum]MCM1196230.1 sugar ABC transporter permease [Roseburia sp.]MCM1556052.1 sugar ABC transporter permease [Anaeroplasma bactoclasticum]